MLKAPNSEAGDGFGFAVALAETTLAVGAPGEAGGRAGVGGDQNDNARPDAGAVMLY